MSEQRYLDPKNDVAFKKLFENKTRLMSFLNSVLRLSGDREIVDLVYLPQEEVPLLPGHKKGIVDVRCCDQAGHKFIVEMQKDYVAEFLQRAQFYGAYAYVSQLGRGASHLELKPVVVLSIVNYPLFPDNPDYINFYEMRNTKTNDTKLNAIGYTFVELSKFNKNKDECENLEEEWVYTLKNAQEELSPPFQDAVLLDAYNTLERFRWDQTVYEAYLVAKIATDEEAATRNEKYEEGVEKGMKKGIRKGRKEGMEKGRKEGIAQGIEKGRTDTKIELARSMLDAGVAVDVITQVTGLAVDEFSE